MKPLETAESSNDIICISILDWNHPTLIHAVGQIMERFAKQGQRVFFVNQPLRWLNDYKQIRKESWLRRKLIDWRKGFVEVSPNFYSFTPPPILPLNRIKSRRIYNIFLNLNSRLFRASLKRALKPCHVIDPIVWISLDPELGEAILGKLEERVSVYHCIDELSGFTNLSKNLLDLEQEVVHRCNLVIATSERLSENKKAFNPMVYTVTNAADIEHFKKALDPLPTPIDLAAVPHPRFGFIGQFEQRFDVEMLQAVATARPDWHFVLIGPVREGYAEGNPFLQLPNVHSLGPRPHEQLPAYLRGLDVCLIPYKIDRLTMGIYPMKLHEYLASGKPVLASALPSLSQFSSVITIVNNAQEFLVAGEEALRYLDDPILIADRVSVAEHNDWSQRLLEIKQILLPYLGGRSG